jgi:hypothetical protein
MKHTIYKVRFYSLLLLKEIIKEFASLREAADFAHEVNGTLIGY